MAETSQRIEVTVGTAVVHTALLLYLIKMQASHQYQLEYQSLQRWAFFFPDEHQYRKDWKLQYHVILSRGIILHSSCWGYVERRVLHDPFFPSIVA